MIYLIISEQQMVYRNLPKYIIIPDKEYGRSSMILRYSADSIFKFKNGKTMYIKDRFGTKHQYSSEDMVAIRLQSMLL